MSAKRLVMLKEVFSLDGLSALCGHCIKHSQTGELHRYTFER